MSVLNHRSAQRTLHALLILFCMNLSTSAADKPTFNSPKTKTGNQTDDYHGTKVADPYRWLEDDVRESKEVATWVEQQNEQTFGYLHAIPEREQIKARLTELWNYEKFSSPFKQGGRYYFYKNDGLQNQYVLYVSDTLNGKPQVLIDPNTWTEDGTKSLSGTYFSDDGKYVAYGVSEAGSDWKKFQILEIAAGKILDETLDWVKFSGAEWTKDSQGFFYNRYPEVKEGDEFQNLNLNQKVYFHRVGTPQSDDVMVYERPDHPEWGFGTDVSDDGQWLVLTVWKGTDDKYQIFYRDLTEPLAGFTQLIDQFENEYSFLGNDGRVFYFQTDVDAPRGRVIAVDTGQPEKEHWKEIIPQAEETLRSTSLVGGHFLAEYLKDARSQVKVFAMNGQFVREVKFDGIGSASGFSGKRNDTETFYSFSSFDTPPSIYRYDITTGESKLLRQAVVDFDGNDYVVEQVFYESKDGTKIPMFLTHRKGLKKDGNNPTLLYGYGGFNIAITPGFSISRAAWLEMGGVLAVANLRGGGEYGETWHQAGTKLNKQNVFDDFISAAEWLIAEKYTSTPKLAIQGRSNGGLLVGAVMAQRPDLFGACLPGVGVMDMLRFHKFTAGRFWVDDYGSADDPEEFKALYAYSPYHNLKPGTAYPPTMVTTADTDDRVVPGHSFKFAARLQECHQGNAPVMIRIETKAGHGAGKPTAKIIEEVADEWSFLVESLDMTLPETTTTTKGTR
ncbi:MAG: prolyl oligopeptidase family serine peptidase [Planctomycetaceae bacterium]|nr:prolyl oligopeptidase family serine peptidase [Planctomycetaceae bacterium]